MTGGGGRHALKYSERLEWRTSSLTNEGGAVVDGLYSIYHNV